VANVSHFWWQLRRPAARKEESKGCHLEKLTLTDTWDVPKTVWKGKPFQIK